jgi:hypothetical protein
VSDADSELIAATLASASQKLLLGMTTGELRGTVRPPPPRSAAASSGIFRAPFPVPLAARSQALSYYFSFSSTYYYYYASSSCYCCILVVKYDVSTLASHKIPRAQHSMPIAVPMPVPMPMAHGLSTKREYIPLLPKQPSFSAPSTLGKTQFVSRRSLLSSSSLLQ